MNKLKSQQGIGLIVFFLTVLAAGSVFFLSTMDNSNTRISNENKTSESLARAKEALLSYAVNYYTSASNAGNLNLGFHGLLPCPELAGSANEGVSAGNCSVTHTNRLGRFPWRSLDLPPLKDASGECLWYALSGGFFNAPRSKMVNADTPGMFQIFNEQGLPVKGATPEDRVVAVILAPGEPLSNQTRPPVIPNSNLPCEIAYNVVNAIDYLDADQGIDNAVVDSTNVDIVDQFIYNSSLSLNPSLNDRLITITVDEIYNAIRMNNNLNRTRINLMTNTIIGCLTNYANNSNTASSSIAPITAFNLPWPAALEIQGDYRVEANYVDASAVANTLGRFPFSTPASYAATTSINIFTDNTSCPLLFNNPLDPAFLKNEIRILWDNWKDHLFYIVHNDYLPGASSVQNSNSCTGANCLTMNGNSYAALLIFSDQRLPNPPFNQLRQDPYVEAGTVSGNFKTEITNYLEGTNATSSTTFGDYSALPLVNQLQVNDHVYCMRITSAGLVPAYTINAQQLPVCN